MVFRVDEAVLEVLEVVTDDSPSIDVLSYT